MGPVFSYNLVLYRYSEGRDPKRYIVIKKKRG